MYASGETNKTTFILKDNQLYFVKYGKYTYCKILVEIAADGKLSFYFFFIFGKNAL